MKPKNFLFASFLLAQIAAVLYFCPDPARFARTLSATLGAPLAAYWAWRRGKIPLSAAWLLFAAALGGDLFLYMRSASFLYRGQTPPSSFLRELDPRLTGPVPTPARMISVPLLKLKDDQAVRYFELLQRKPYVFSSPVSAPAASSEPFKTALSGRRWNSYLLLKNYFALTHSGIEPAVLEAMFAVNASPFQLKNGTVAVPDAQAAAFFTKLGKAKSLDLLRRAVIVDAGPERPSAGPQPSFDYSILDYEHNSFAMTTKSDKDGILYWADGYDRWWKAFLNGREVPILRANVNFKALELPKGENALRFVYDPKPFRFGLWVYNLALAGALLGAALSSAGGKKGRPSS